MYVCVLPPSLIVTRKTCVMCETRWHRERKERKERIARDLLSHYPYHPDQIAKAVKKTKQQVIGIHTACPLSNAETTYKP